MLKILIALILVKALLTIPLQPPEGVVEKNLPTTPEFQQSVLEYWTADKMKNAKPYPRPKANGIILQQHEQIEEQEPSPVPVHQYRSFPYRVVGRVYFTRDGQDFVCSAASTGGDAVITAAHCISDTGDFHSNWIFRAHNKTWAGKRLSVFKAWHHARAINKNVGFGIVETSHNTTLQQIVGALPLNTTCQGEVINAIGFSNNKLIHLEAAISRLNTAFRPPMLGLVTRLGGRGFGGPWICRRNYICGVSSIQDEGGQVIWSPGFDNKVLSLRKYAINV